MMNLTMEIQDNILEEVPAMETPNYVLHVHCLATQASSPFSHIIHSLLWRCAIPPCGRNPDISSNIFYGCGFTSARGTIWLLLFMCPQYLTVLALAKRPMRHWVSLARARALSPSRSFPQTSQLMFSILLKESQYSP